MKSINRIISLVAVLSVLTACGPELSPDEKGNNNASNTETGGSGNGSSANNGKDDSGTGGDSGNAEGSGSSGDSGSTGDTGESGGNSGDNQEVNPDDKFTIAEEFAGGDGSEKNPYQIKTAAQLRKLSADCAKGIHYREVHFRLENDIRFNKNVLDENGELNGIVLKFEQWVPIGKNGTLPFGGNFNGNGHTIYGLVCTDSSYEYVGLFGNCMTVTNLTIKDSYFEGKKYVGSIAGRIDRVINCVNYATVKNTSSGEYTGGIAGNIELLADFCGNFGKVYGGNAAGVAGRAKRIRNSFNYGNVDGSSWVAGIVAIFPGSAYEIANCVNLGVISCRTSKNLRVGGIASYFSRFQVVINVVNYGMVLKSVSGIGALVGTYFKDNSAGPGNYTKLCHGYYLESTSYSAVGANSSLCPQTDVLSMKSEEMKSQGFLDKLNANVAELKEIYPKYNFCNWKFGKDGFPVLDWME